MSFSIYELEAAQEGSVDANQLVNITSSVLTMTASFVFCAVFITVVLSGTYLGWLYLFLSTLKAVLLAAMMVFVATIITQIFGTALVRRVNSMILGMVMAFVLVFFNIM